MDSFELSNFSEQTLCDITTIIKNVGIGSTDACSRIETAIRAILNDVARHTSSNKLELQSSFRTLHLLLQVCENCDSLGNGCISELAVKSLEILSLFLQKTENTLDAVANTLCNIVNLSFVLMSPEDYNKHASLVISKCEEALSVYLTSDIKQANTFEPHIAVQLLSAVLRAVCKREDLCNTNGNNLRIKHELVAELCLCKDDSLRSQTLLILFPKLLTYERKNVFLEKLFNVIVKSESEESLSRALAALSALCTYYFPDSESNVTLSVEGSNALWLLIQRGVCSDLPLSRKHALFLIRKCVSSLVSKQKEVNCDMFFWSSDQKEKLFSWWQAICTILEVLEERAFHLVSPVLGTLQNIFSCVNEDLASSCFLNWCLTVFQRLLQHSCIHVVKWGVDILIDDIGCNLISSKHAKIFHQFFLNTLIHSLNTPQIYYEMEDESKHDQCLSDFEYLTKYFVSAAKSETRQELFITLFDTMGSINWSPISLYIFSRSLTKVPPFKCLKPEDTPIFKRLVNKILATQNVSIRSACLQYMLVTVINLTNFDNFSLKALQDILSAFYLDGNLTRNTELWNRIVSWISQTFKEDQVVSWITENATSSVYFPPVFAQLVTLLSDAHLVKEINSLENLFGLLSDCDTRLYVDQEAQTKCVEFVANMLSASKSSDIHNKQSCDKTRQTVLYIVKTTMPSVSLLFKKRLLNVDNLTAYHIATRLLKCFEIFCQDIDVAHILLEEKSLVRFVSVAFDIVENDLFEKKVNFAFAMTIVKSWCENEDLINCQLSEKRDQVLKKILQSNILVEAPFAQTLKLPQWTAEILGPISSSVFEAQWEFIAVSISESSYDDFGESLLEAVSVGLDAGGRNLLPILLKVLRKVEAKHPTSDNFAPVFRNCWSSILEVRQKDIFYPSLREFLGALFQPGIVQTQWGGNIVSECGEELLSWGESAVGVIAELAFALRLLIHQSPEVILQEPIRNLVVSCFVMSTIQRRDQKFLRRITSSITCKQESNSVLQLLKDDPFAFIRCSAVEILVWLISRAEVSTTKIADLLTEELLKQTETPEAKRARYFSNSLTHRIHLHVLQGLILVEPRTSNESKKALGKRLLQRLLTENHQLSVRYLIEWLIVRILRSIENFRSDLLQLVKAGEIRESALCSVICTLLQFSQSLEVEPKEIEDAGNFLSQFFEALLPLTMSQAYSVRFNAHVAILRVWETMEKLRLQREIDLYKISALAVRKSFTRATNKFQNHKDFYLTEFRCLEHFSLETLFYDMPRLTHMSQDECLEIHLFRTLGISETSPVPLTNKDNRLREFIPTVNRRSETSNVIAQSNCIQKKMVPSKWLDINELLVKSLPEVLRPWKKEDDHDLPRRGLVVVASLLDKASNLGGLSRTCEIMGASLVLPKMSYASDREFQALSMSSEMWAPLSEVKTHKLPEFLSEMKNRGFKLVGAEQTASSTPLNGFHFDEDTVLLLGNECEGIPSNLLPILDVCVEIPQFGLVRSLNVHVAGALFIYEYRRQHSAIREGMTY